MVPKELQDARETYKGALLGIERLQRTMQGQGVFAVDSAEGVVEQLLAQLEVSDALMVPCLGAMTPAASAAATALGPCVLALRIGMELDHSRQEVARLGLASLLLDLARGRVTSERDSGALRRSGEALAKLTRDRGAAYADVADLVRRSAEVVQGWAGTNEGSRDVAAPVHIVTMASAYHELARGRGADERSWPSACLKDFIRGQRARFPDTMLKILIRVLTSLPVGSLVRLNSGEIGYVVAKNERFPLRPVVAIWVSLGKPLAEAKSVDLLQNPFLHVEAFLADTKLDRDLGVSS